MAQPKLNGLHGYVTAEEPVNQESVLPLTPEEVCEKKMLHDVLTINDLPVE